MLDTRAAPGCYSSATSLCLGDGYGLGIAGPDGSGVTVSSPSVSVTCCACRRNLSVGSLQCGLFLLSTCDCSLMDTFICESFSSSCLVYVIFLLLDVFHFSQFITKAFPTSLTFPIREKTTYNGRLNRGLGGDVAVIAERRLQ